MASLSKTTFDDGSLAALGPAPDDDVLAALWPAPLALLSMSCGPALSCAAALSTPSLAIAVGATLV